MHFLFYFLCCAFTSKARYIDEIPDFLFRTSISESISRLIGKCAIFFQIAGHVHITWLY